MNTGKCLAQALSDKVREFEGREFYVVILVGSQAGHDISAIIHGDVNPRHVAEGMARATTVALEKLPSYEH